jgi:membrane-bound lytic murein transglycosylase A
VDRSAAWFQAPSTKAHFPVPGVEHVTHQRAALSVKAFRALLGEAKTAPHFEQLLQDNFDCFMSVGWNGEGVVLFTGYFTPVYRASRERTAVYRYPLYKRPDDLVTDPATGKPLGRKVGDDTEPYPTRREIEEQQLLAGQELAWLPSKFDAYIIHVQGSAKLQLEDGGVMYVGYAGKTDRPYYGLGQAMLDDAKVEPERLSVPAIRAYFNEHPEELDDYLYRNESYVFFREYDGANWPAGSLGFAVTPLRSVATDKRIFPRASVVIAETRVPSLRDPMQTVPFTQFMLDQDTGGAIQAPGRGDLYMGIGHQAEHRAGRQYQEGRLYYFFLKTSKMLEWQQRLRETPSDTNPAEQRADATPVS